MKKFFQEYLWNVNSLHPDQAGRSVGPDLGPNCLPRLSADGTGRQKVNDKTTGHGKIQDSGDCL